MCEPCQTPRRDPDVRIPWSKAAGLEKGRVAAGEAIRTAASLPVVRQAVASLEQLLQKAQRDFRLAQGPDVRQKQYGSRRTSRSRAAGWPPWTRTERDASRDATALPPPRPPAPPRPPRRGRAAATGERHEAAGRGHHERPSRALSPAAREARGCSTWKASLPAQEELLFAPLANLGCVVDVFISTDPSPRFAEMLRDYEAFANATNGSTTIAEVAAKHRKHQDSPQKPKVLAALDAVAAAGRAYDAIIVWRFDVQPLDAITTWPVRAGAVSVPFREAALREFPTRGRPRRRRRRRSATGSERMMGASRTPPGSWTAPGCGTPMTRLRRRAVVSCITHSRTGRPVRKSNFHCAVLDRRADLDDRRDGRREIEVVAEGFYDTGQANPVFRICRSKVPCGPQADANAGTDHCEPLGAAARGETLTLEALLAGGWPAPVELVRRRRPGFRSLPC